jgi:predicted DCC family thiol-disulfide oxidoreductase YuxK
MKGLPEHVVLFDGICNLCNRSVQYVIKNDPAGKFRFIPMQSVAGRSILTHYKKSHNNYDSFVYIQNGKWQEKSSAALKLSWQLRGGNKLFILFWLVPKFIRDLVYSLVAKNRYKWFGKMEVCMIPRKNEEALFITDFKNFE